MASLYKRGGWYYLQFFHSKRSPRRKQVALKTTSKRTAEKLQSRRQDACRLGDYDRKDQETDDSVDLSRLEDAIEAFLAAKSHLSEKYRTMLTSLLRQLRNFDPHITRQRP